MEKTFREVIADIKEGEVWESNLKTIKCHSDGIQIYHKDKERYTPFMLILDEDKFTLRIKEYIFEEAFREYEKGDIEIESKTTGNRFKKVDGNDMFFQMLLTSGVFLAVLFLEAMRLEECGILKINKKLKSRFYYNMSILRI